VPPALLGGGGAAGSTTVSILPGAYGDLTATGNGTALVTYDAAYGIRLLSTNSEFSAGITSGQSQLDNVRYVNTSGSGIVTATLTQDTVINSLSFEETGIGTNTGIQISGNVPTRQLTVNSGVIFARQTVSSAVGSDAMFITNLTLNLNGQEGVIVCQANGLNQGNTPAPLYICAAITNDGGKGVTIGTIGGGNGEVYFSGNATNSYTGPTTVNSGYLRLSRTPASISIPGNLIVNGGTVIKSSEAVPDTADLTLNGGSFYFDNTTSSGNNGHQETIRNLFMNGGAISFNTGKSHRFYINGDAVINVGDLKLNTGGDVTVLGTTTLNGGRVLVSLSDSTTSVDAFFTLRDVVITNLTEGAYAAIVLKAHATNKGGKLAIGGTVTVVGNSVNTNSVLFDSEDRTLAQQGVIALDGTRTFDIGDGAASTDLLIFSTITNNGANVGSMIKNGAGTLALNGANAYTGATAVSNGTLAVNGNIVSPVTVSGGAVLTGTGVVSVASGTALTVGAGGIVDPGASGAVGTLTVTGNVSFADASVLRVDVDGSRADVLAVSGTVSGGTVSVQKVGGRTEPWLILTATAITGSFVSADPGLSIATQANNTELWLVRRVGTLITVQ
jgi:autotransporter-associated beta strand protein